MEINPQSAQWLWSNFDHVTLEDMLETQGQMKTPSEEREQEKQNKAMQSLLELLKDQILDFGDRQATCQTLIDESLQSVLKPKTVEEKVALPPDIEALLLQGRMAELTQDQLATLEKYRKPIK